MCVQECRDLTRKTSRFISNISTEIFSLFNILVLQTFHLNVLSEAVIQGAKYQSLNQLKSIINP